METIRISNLKPGQIFHQALFSASGQKLLPPHVLLTDRHIQAIRRCGDLEVFGADSLDELVEAGIVDRFDSSKLAVGQKAKRELMSRSGQVLVESGEEVEEHHLKAIRASGSDAFATKHEDKSSRRERILMADALVDDLLQHVSGMKLRIEPGKGPTWLDPGDRADWPSVAELAEVRARAVSTITDLYARIEAGVEVEAKAFDPIVDDLTRRLKHHPQQFTQLALLIQGREDYLPDHAYTTTVLAMAIGAAMKWTESDVRLIGRTGLVFELGMLLVPERIRVGMCELSEIDRGRVQRHPVFTLSMLQAVKGIEPIVQLAALQHHERENGMGYPNSTRKDEICDLARVLAVADTYAAATEPRSYRNKKLPYTAMEETIRSTSTNAFWKPAARALVQAAGLFPVGSYVRLSNNGNAHVISANPKALDRPMVQPLNREGQPSGPPLDLADNTARDITVVRPLPGPTG